MGMGTNMRQRDWRNMRWTDILIAVAHDLSDEELAEHLADNPSPLGRRVLERERGLRAQIPQQRRA